MIVSAERGACCGHGACVEICPAVFAIDEADGLVEVIDPDPPAEEYDRVRLAVEECPTDAIVITEGDA